MQCIHVNKLIKERKAKIAGGDIKLATTEIEKSIESSSLPPPPTAKIGGEEDEGSRIYAPDLI